jgi:TonB family protein
MRAPDWIREALAGYRWLWRAQLRWGRAPRWLAPFRFAGRVAEDLLDATIWLLCRGSLQAPSLAAAHPISRSSPMTTPNTVPAFGIVEGSANERLKANFGSWLWSSMIVAAVVHFGAFALWPSVTATDISIDGKELTTIELPPDIPIPPPPQPIAAPAAPVVSTADIPDDVTIPPTTWQENPVEALPPPPDDVRAAGSAVPSFSPFTVAPVFLNPDEVVRAMTREYPTVLRDSGIGGTVRVEFSIDEEGRVLHTRIDESSGYPAFDEAALTVSDVIRFSPALNRDKRVAVRVVFPIVFRVEGGEE